MKCPFPGMDPYLEHRAYWQDFHSSFLIYAREWLLGRVPKPYQLNIEENIRLVEAEPDGTNEFDADIALTRGVESPRRAATALAESVVLPLAESAWAKFRHLRLVVTREEDESVVAVLELLSPWNKRGEGFGEFQRKRSALLSRGTHWVEIDLLVGGRRTELKVPRPPGEYFATAIRHWRPAGAEICGWSVRAPLPVVPIPLDKDVPDLPLDLAAAFAMTYERTGIGEKLMRRRYGKPIVAKLSEDDRRWAAEIAAATASVA